MSDYMSSRFSSLTPYTPGEQPKDKKYIKLNTNENPYPPSQGVIDAIGTEQLESLNLYPDPTCSSLKKVLSEKLGVGQENIFCSNGSDEALDFAVMCFGEKGVVFPDITYGFYKVFCDYSGYSWSTIPLKEDFTIDPSDYCNLNKLIIIANPNAPSGLALSKDAIEEIVRTNSKGVVIVDEAYIDFGGESALPLINKYDNILVTRTFSKSYSMAGGRVGYAVGNPALIADLLTIKYSTNPYNIDRLNLAAATQSIIDQEYYDRCTEKIKKTREKTKEELKKLGFDVIDTQTNFVFAKTDKVYGKDLYLRLKEKGILIRYFPGERTGEYIRVTVGTDPDMDSFIIAIKEILEEQ